MKTLLARAEELTRKAATIRAEANALKAKETLSADEMKRLDALFKEADGVDVEATDLRGLAERADANEKKLAGYSAPQPRKTTTERELIVARESFLDDPKRGYKDMRAFFNDLVLAAAGRPSKQILSLRPSRSYLTEGAKGLSQEEIQAAAGSDEHSGFYAPSLGAMLPTALMDGVLETSLPEDPFPDTLRFPMTSPSAKFFARTDKDHTTSLGGGAIAYRRAESGTVGATRVGVEEIVLVANSLMCASFETEELMQDAPGAALALIQRGMAEATRGKRSNEMLHGAGVGGEYLGLLESPAKVTITKETGQANDTIILDNLTKMLSRLWGNGRFVASKTCIPQLAKLNGGTNGLVWLPSAREGMPGTLLGIPIQYSEFCPVLGDEGDIGLYNMGQFLEGVRQDPQTEESIHVRFFENERAFRMTTRNCGAPWWRAPLTPVRGSTLSPIVILGAR